MAEQSLAPRDGGADRWHCLTGEIEEVPIGQGARALWAATRGQLGAVAQPGQPGAGLEGSGPAVWCLVKYMHSYIYI